MRRIGRKALALALAAVLALPGVSAQGAQVAVTAPAAVLMEASTGQVLFEKGAHDRRACASITKVMTLLLTFEALEAGELSLDQELTASAHAASMGGSQIWLEENEQMTVSDMLKAVCVVSANDCAVALAEAVSGSEEAFVARMNERAKELGMEDTVFKNCNGLDEEGHLTSAYDVAVMSRALLAHEKIRDYTLTWMDSVRNGETQLVNTNKLIRSYQGITGLKTGTTGQAGSCISATAQREGMELIAVVLGAESTDLRFQDAKALLDYGFAGWKTVTPDTPFLQPAAVEGGMAQTVEVTAGEMPSLLLQAAEEAQVETVVQLEPVKAPVEQGQELGRILCQVAGETVAQVPITAQEGVEAVTFGAAFLALGRALFTL